MFTNCVYILWVFKLLIVWHLRPVDAPLYQQVSDKGLAEFFGTKVRNPNVNHRIATKEGGASAPILKFASASRVTKRLQVRNLRMNNLLVRGMRLKEELSQQTAFASGVRQDC